MSIMDFFRPGTAPTPQATPQQQQQPTAAGQQQTAPTPSLNQEVPAADQAAAVDPMDKFKELWAPTKPVEGAEPEFNPSAIFNLDPESMQKAVGGINFADMVTEESIAAISAGGPEAVKAMIGMLNATGAKTMTLATTAAAKMVEQGLTKATGALDKKITNGVKLNQVNSQLQELNPALNSPAAAPMVQALTAQLTNKFPMSSPAEISGLVTEYMKNFAELAAGKKAPEVPEASKEGTDWEKYMG